MSARWLMHSIDATTESACNAPRITRSMRPRRWRGVALWAAACALLLVVAWL